MNGQPQASKPLSALRIPTSGWICAMLVLGVFAVYWPVIGYKFTFLDDPDYVWLNPHVASGLSWPGVVWAFTSFDCSNWHPLTWLSHMLDVQLFGMRAGGHHAVNVLFHAANTVLLFLLLKRLTGALWRSAFVAALFGSHPLHVESVAWVAERKDVLSTFFFMLTLLAYVRYARRRPGVESRESSAASSGGASVPASRLVSSLAPPGHSPTVPDLGSGSLALDARPSTNLALDSRLSSLDYALALFFFALGLMAKPMLVTLPFVLLLLDFWPLNRIRNSSTLRSRTTAEDGGFGIRNFTKLVLEKIPFFALSAVSCVVTYLAQAHGGAVKAISVLPFDVRIQNAFLSYVLYLEKMVWPTSLAVYYPYVPIDSASVATAIFVLLLISGAVILSLRRRPYLAVSWFWFLGTLVPVIGVVQVGAQALADRYTYVPLIGLFIAITWGVSDLLDGCRYRRTLLTILSVAVLATCLRLTATQVCYWRNTETLMRHSLSVTPDNADMEVLLGNALVDDGRSAEATTHFSDALRLQPDNLYAQSGLASAMADQGHTEEAIKSYRAAVALHPGEPKPHYMLANLLSQQGNFAEAIAEYQTTLQLDPQHPLALNDLAWLLATAPDARFRDGAEAVKRAEEGCRVTGYSIPLFVGTLAAAYAEAGRFDDAVKTAEQAINLATAQNKQVLADKNRDLLKLYQAKRAYHQPAADHL